MKDIKSRNDIQMNAITYNTLIDLFVRVSHLDKAYSLINEMKLTSIQPDSFT